MLGFYAQRLPADERELLTRLAVFPRGITLDLLAVLVDAGGAVAGLLADAKPALPRLLARLVERGLVFCYPGTDQTLTWTAHPFVRQRFAQLLGCPANEVFDAVAERLGQGLDQRPEHKPQDVASLDRYEQLIEATRLAGREQEAFDLYWFGLGGYGHLGKCLGDYARGYRILRGFLPGNGDLEHFGEGMPPRAQAAGLGDFALTARQLGRLREALAVRREDDDRKRHLDEPVQISIGFLNNSELACDLGLLHQALDGARRALREAERTASNSLCRHALTYSASAAHLAGDIGAALTDFDAAAAIEDDPRLYSVGGQQHARHHLDRGDLSACRAIVEAGLPISHREGWNHELPGWQALLARLALAEGLDPQTHLSAIRAWTARSGEVKWIIEAHALAARYALVQADLARALAEADDGLRQARLCGYRLLEIELLITLSAIHLAWPDAGAALAAARQALDLATLPDCGYAWGEADAAQAWGQAFVALGQPELAERAFNQALAVCQRIGHPQTQATHEALAQLAGRG